MGFDGHAGQVMRVSRFIRSKIESERMTDIIYSEKPKPRTENEQGQSCSRCFDNKYPRDDRKRHRPRPSTLNSGTEASHSAIPPLYPQKRSVCDFNRQCISITSRGSIGSYTTLLLFVFAFCTSRLKPLFYPTRHSLTTIFAISIRFH